MPVWLGLPLAALNGLLVLRDPRRGVLLYVASALVVPHVDVGGLVLTYEILAFPGIVAAAVVAKRRLATPAFHLLLLAYLGLITMATLLSIVRHEASVEWIRFFGLVRFLVLLGLFREVLDREGIETVAFAVIVVNAGVGVVQLLLPGTADLFFHLYGRESQVVLERYAERGLIPRAPGTLGSPVNLGSFALLALALGYSGILEGRSDLGRWTFVVLSGIAGVVSLTKTFFLGAPVVLLLGITVRAFMREDPVFRVRPRSLAAKSIMGLSGLAATVVVAVYMAERGFAVLGYLEVLLEPASALATRYTTPGGTLYETLDVVARNWVTGVGMTTVRGEFIGDSTYVRLLHDGGVAAALLVVFGLVLLAWRSLALRRPLDLVVLAALLMTGVALPLLFTLSGALFVVYLARPPAEAP